VEKRKRQTRPNVLKNKWEQEMWSTTWKHKSGGGRKNILTQTKQVYAKLIPDGQKGRGSSLRAGAGGGKLKKQD